MSRARALRVPVILLIRSEDHAVGRCPDGGGARDLMRDPGTGGDLQTEGRALSLAALLCEMV